MAEIISKISSMTGFSVGGGGGGIDITIIITFIIFAVLFLAICGFGLWWFLKWLQYKYKIKIFQRINGQFQETYIKRARIIPLGKGGDQAILVNVKPNKILPMPSIQSGKNTFCYFISDDGEWINFSHSDFDETRREMGSEFLDKEMRYARTSLEHMGEERYNTKGFWEKYGDKISNAIVILLLCIGLWLVLDKMIEFQVTAGSSAETLGRVAETTESILGKLDNIVSGGSGLVPST